MEFAVRPSKNPLIEVYRVLSVCTGCTTSKETGISLFEKTLHITLAAVASFRTVVWGQDFLVLLLLGFFLVVFLLSSPSILKTKGWYPQS